MNDKIRVRITIALKIAGEYPKHLTPNGSECLYLCISITKIIEKSQKPRNQASKPTQQLHHYYQKGMTMA